MSVLDKKLPAILKGEVKPSSAGEQLGIARLCHYKNRQADSARFYADAFAAQPAFADDLASTNRFTAACAAVLAANRGNGADKQDGQDIVHLRQQALGWLRADLVAWSKQAETGIPQTGTARQMRLKMCQIHSDLASVRDAAALDKLPEAERAEWKKLWADVAELLKQSSESGKK